MAGRRRAKREITSYRHRGEERVNNPPVGLVTGATDPDAGKQTYEYDPHLDPQLTWAGKAEHTSFEVPTVSLHEHERIDPRSIIQAVRRNGQEMRQPSFYDAPEENLPMRQAVEFYKHRKGWTNRLVAGDSLLVMNSLLEKEGLGGQVQMVYIDPPYGIRYGSNFQPFVNNRNVRDRSDADLSQEPETIRAFRDTWELGVHSYLSYLRDRLLLARELLAASGSVFVQISDENVHRVRGLMDEVFGPTNFVSQINYRSMSPLGQRGLANVYDYLIWYARDKKAIKFRPLFLDKPIENEPEFSYIDTGDGDFRKFSKDELSALTSKQRERVFKRSDLASSGYTPSCTYDFKFQGKTYRPRNRKSWRTHKRGMENLIRANRLFALGSSPYFRQFHSDYPLIQLENSWGDTAAGFGEPKIYAVQTNVKIVARCILMTTDPGDLVFDPSCGSGTTAYIAEQWGRRWVTCDTSRVAITLARQRLMTGHYDYYQLAYPDEGVGSGFVYKTAPHVTLGSIANNADIQEGMTQAEIDAAIALHAPQETLYDQPVLDPNRTRVAGPFTVEAVPAPAVRPLDESREVNEPDESSSPITEALEFPTARSGETTRQADWREELLETGIRGRAGQRIDLARLEPQAGTRWLHAVGETTQADVPQRVAVSFGPEHAPLEQRQVERAWEEVRLLNPQPDLLVFAAFQFDPEAAKDIDEMSPALVGMQLLKAQMNADLLTEDLKRKRSSNESFWLIGQPDVEVRQAGECDGIWEVEVRGFDYFDTRKGGVDSGGADRIAVWMLDPDYDGRSLFPEQVFFPMAGARDGWARLARNLKAEIDTDLIEAYRGTVSLPFEAGEHGRVAVKIVDDRGIESLKVVALE